MLVIPLHSDDMVTVAGDCKARFPLPELTARGDQFSLPVNTGRVDGRVFPLAELTGHDG